MSRSNFYNNYYQSFMSENMNPLYRRYLEYLSSDLPDVSDIGGFIDVPTTAEREGLESLLDTTRIPVDNMRIPRAPLNQQREGGGGPRGIGRFGNLDPDSRRKVLIDGVLTDVYTNITSGLTQTFDGKNVKGGIDTIFDPSNLGGVTLATDGDDDGYDYDYSTFGPAVLGFNAPAFSGASPFSLDKRREDAITNQFEFERKLREEEEARQKKIAEEKAKREAEIERAQRAEVERIRQENERLDKGGYQSDFKQDKNFMEGEGRGRGNDPDDKGGSDTMGSF